MQYICISCTILSTLSAGHILFPPAAVLTVHIPLGMLIIYVFYCVLYLLLDQSMFSFERRIKYKDSRGRPECQQA